MHHVFRPAAAVCAAVFLAAPLAAQSTWNGGGGNGLWSNGGATGNWSAATAPASGATTAIIFDGTSQLTTTQDITAAGTPFVLNTLTFNAGAGAFSIGGNELRFGGASNVLTQNSTNNIAITAPVSWDGTGSIGGSGTGSLTLSSLNVRQGTLTLNRNVTVGALTLGLDLGAPAVISTGTNVLTLGGDVTFVQLTGTGTVQAPPATLNGIINLGGADRTFHGIYSTAADDPFIDLTINATITGTGGFIKGGSLTEDRTWMIFNAANTYTGPTVLQSGSERLYLGIANSIPSTSAVTVMDSSQLYLSNVANTTGNAGFSQVFASLSDGGTTGGEVRIGQDSAATITLTTGGDNSNTRFAGLISGGGKLIKTGSGTFTLTNAANSYSGGTDVSAGTLIVNGATTGPGTGPVTVFNGATLAGSGRIPGLTTVNNGGKISGNLTLAGGLVFQSGSTFNASLNGNTPANYSQLNVTGPLNLTGINLTTQLGYTPANGDKLFIVVKDSTDAITGTFNTFPQNGTVTLGTFTAQISYIGDSVSGLTTGGNDVVLFNFTPIPEPTTLLGLAGLGLGGVQFLRRRTRR